MKYFFYILFLMYGLSGFSQDKSTTKVIRQKLIEANYYFQYDNFYDAMPIFQKIVEIDSSIIEANFKLGVCIFNTNPNKTNAKKYFEKSKSDFNDSYFYLARILHSEQLFDQAINNYKYYNSLKGKLTFDEKVVDYYVEKSQVAKQLITSKANIKIENLGENINSLYPDYGVVLSSTEKQFYFTSRRNNSIGQLKNPFGEYYEDIYVSNHENGNWLSAKNLQTPVNTAKHDACVSISNDGNELYIYRTNQDSSGGDIYISQKVEDNWTTPQIINADINALLSWTPSGSISSDGNTFFFASNRDGGMGGKDIYKVSKLPTGIWSLAQNLGASINTQYDEDGPFITADGNTLYFSSKGHKNMGEFDVFVSHLDSITWSTPENLGYPINSIENDIYYVPSSDMISAYLSTNRKEGLGDFDIYKVHDINHITNYVPLKGKVNNEQTQILKATISIIDYHSKELQGIYKTNQLTGKYLLILFKNRKYKMIVESEGYQSYIEDFELKNDFTEKELIKDIKLIKNE